MSFGLGKPNLAESGVKIMCKARITGASEETFILEVSFNVWVMKASLIRGTGGLNYSFS